jgi:hypothetical protein
VTLTKGGICPESGDGEMTSKKEKIPRGSPKAKYLGNAKIKRRAGGAIKSFEYSQYASGVRKIDPSTIDLSKYEK